MARRIRREVIGYLPGKGVIVLPAKEVVGPGPDRGVGFQSPCLLPWMTAFENVMPGVNQVFCTAPLHERRQIAEYYLRIVGLGDSLTRLELRQVLIELWRWAKKTALIVTHDLDEALFLSDRIIMMTDGPEAEVGDIPEMNFPRPRERQAVMERPYYYQLRAHFIEFLEIHARKKHAGKILPATPPAGASPAPDRQTAA